MATGMQLRGWEVSGKPGANSRRYKLARMRFEIFVGMQVHGIATFAKKFMLLMSEKRD